MDGELFQTLSKRWHSLVDLDEKMTNITLRIDTTEVRGFLLKAHASLQWPRMFSRYRLKFPITQIGNHTVKDFILENPSSLPVLVQVVPLSLYPNPANIINILKKRYGNDYGTNNILKDAEAFSLEDLEDNNPHPDNHIPAYRESLEEYFGIESHKKSIAMLLTPGMRVRIQVGFTPKDDSLKSSLIVIRNNLTVMDALLVHGQGGYGQIKLGNIPPGSDSILMFELTNRLLKDCGNSQSSKYTTPNFTVRRAFTARNTGALPMYVNGFDINGKLCQGYGFRVLNCQPFELKPNASKTIDIAYTPDFSLTHVERTLNIRTSQGPLGHTIQYKVVATVPRHMLEFCSRGLPRPFWETYLYFISVCLSILMIVTVVACGVFDSQRLLNRFFYPMITLGINTEKMEKDNVFDLNAICTASVDNSCIKDGYKDGLSENKTVSENGTILNSIKNPVQPVPKRKESPNSRDFEDITSDYNRNSKKRTNKRQNHENHCLDPTLIEIKKSQSRNSWTRLLKPPFSFHSCSNINNKPSVATQTSLDSSEDTIKSLKELDIIGDQNINCFINIENNSKFKTKNNNENKYSESNCVKKINEAPLEEETSSTTTEISTTESDISEKDHRLPDICVTSKSQKIQYSKNKSKDIGTGSTNRMLPKSRGNTVVKDYELSTKSKSHKKVKVNTTKAYTGNILKPSTLELPYKPLKSDAKNEGLTMLCADGIISSNVAESFILNDATTNNISEEAQNLGPYQGIRNCVWLKYPPEFNKSMFIETFAKQPPTYSAAVSKDIFTNKEKNEVSVCGLKRNCFENMKTNSARLKRSHNHSLKRNNKNSMISSNHWSSDGMDQIISSDIESKLLGSKLRNWMLQSTYNEISNGFADESKESSGTQCKSNRHKNWPGFDLTPVRESFWDSNYSPSGGSWSDITENTELHTTTPDNIWNGSLTSVWESESTPWSSPSCDTSNTVSDFSGSGRFAKNPAICNENKETAIGEFDPFHTPSALWISELKERNENSTGSSNSNTWSFSLFSNHQALFPENSQDSEETEEKIEMMKSDNST